MTQSTARQIISGVRLEASGRASVDGPTGKRLIALAIELEPYTRHPVDVQHVLAAIIMAADAGDLAVNEPLPATDPPLCKMLARHVDELFARHGGRVARED